MAVSSYVIFLYFFSKTAWPVGSKYNGRSHNSYVLFYDQKATTETIGLRVPRRVFSLFLYVDHFFPTNFDDFFPFILLLKISNWIMLTDFVWFSYRFQDIMMPIWDQHPIFKICVLSLILIGLFSLDMTFPACIFKTDLTLLLPVYLKQIWPCSCLYI